MSAEDMDPVPKDVENRAQLALNATAFEFPEFRRELGRD